MAQNKRMFLNCNWLSREEAETQGFHAHAGYYLKSEMWMAKNVEKDLQAVSRPYVAVDDNIRGLEIWVK